MKKALSIFAALVMAVICVVPAYALENKTTGILFDEHVTMTVEANSQKETGTTVILNTGDRVELNIAGYKSGTHYGGFYFSHNNSYLGEELPVASNGLWGMIYTWTEADSGYLSFYAKNDSPVEQTYSFSYKITRA